MRIQARQGSPAEQRYLRSALPGTAWPMPKAIVPGVSPRPFEDLIFHGGKTLPEHQFRVYSEGDNGIPVFDQPLKNVVRTLYHELNEFRTDADVNDAIVTGNNDFLGWMSRTGKEVGDDPISAAPSLSLVFREILATTGETRIPVQFMYSNRVHGPEGPIEIVDGDSFQTEQSHA